MMLWIVLGVVVLLIAIPLIIFWVVCRYNNYLDREIKKLCIKYTEESYERWKRSNEWIDSQFHINFWDQSTEDK